MKKFVLLLIVGVTALAAYNQSQAPGPSALEAYLDYHQTVAAGRSFEEDKTYYSTARQAEVAAQVNGSADPESLKAAYLDFTQSQASCSQLELAEDTETSDAARLVFNVTDTCDTYDEGTKVQEIIEMVKEDGAWKIAANETSISQ